MKDTNGLKVSRADVVDGNVIIIFDDGLTVIYSAVLLVSMISEAKVVEEQDLEGF